MFKLHKLQLFNESGKFMFKLFILSLYFLIFPKMAFANNSIIVQSTTSTYNSGFYEYILPLIKTDTNIVVHLVSVGTGAALKNAANCDGDVIIVHAKNRELEFVKNGFGVNRQDLMYNDFVIVGPKSNPAKVKITDDPIKVFTKIYNTSSIFISRGDDSGTHFKEMQIWKTSKKRLHPNFFLIFSPALFTVIRDRLEKIWRPADNPLSQSWGVMVGSVTIPIGVLVLCQ